MANAFVVADSFAYYADAAVAKALLEEAGVKAVLDNVYSSEAWSGTVGQIKVLVPESQETKARRLLSEIRASSRLTAMRKDEPLDDGACLRCGAAMQAAQSRCPRCGWEPEGEEVTDYANGPVPASFLPYAYAPIGTRRFGLRPELIPQYVAEVRAAGKRIDGWELWAHSAIGHVTLEIVDHGNDAALVTAATSIPKDRAWDTYFSPNVRNTGAMSDEEASSEGELEA